MLTATRIQEYPYWLNDDTLVVLFYEYTPGDDGDYWTAPTSPRVEIIDATLNSNSVLPLLIHYDDIEKLEETILEEVHGLA